jgi:hypothetical protein
MPPELPLLWLCPYPQECVGYLLILLKEIEGTFLSIQMELEVFSDH